MEDDDRGGERGDRVMYSTQALPWPRRIQSLLEIPEFQVPQGIQSTFC